MSMKVPSGINMANLTLENDHDLDWYRYLIFNSRGSGKNWLLKQTQKEGNMFGQLAPSIGLDWGAGTWKNAWHEVKITKAHNGWIVKVGCISFVETDWNKICKALKEYWDDPVKAEKKYYKK
jgi:hypothetical protein